MSTSCEEDQELSLIGPPPWIHYSSLSKIKSDDPTLQEWSQYGWLEGQNHIPKDENNISRGPHSIAKNKAHISDLPNCWVVWAIKPKKKIGGTHLTTYYRFGPGPTKVMFPMMVWGMILALVGNCCFSHSGLDTRTNQKCFAFLFFILILLTHPGHIYISDIILFRVPPYPPL